MSRKMREKDGSNLPVRGASGRDGSSGAGTVASIAAGAQGQGIVTCRMGKVAHTVQGSEFSI